MLILLDVLGVYVVLIILTAWVSLHPFRTPMFLSPGQLGAPHEPVELMCDGNRLRGWWVPAENPTAAAVLVHGYMMNRSELVPEAAALWRRGVSCLLIELRGQGKSGGSICTLGNLERRDVAAAAAFARQKCPGARVIAVACSMGAAATALALGDDPALFDAAVLDSAFTTLPKAVLGWWRFLGGEPLRIVLAPTVLCSWAMVGFNPFQVSVTKALARFEIPLLFFHGERDPLALPADARENLAAAKGPKRIVWFEGCGHSEGRIEYAERYQQEILAFFEELGFLRPQSVADQKPDEGPSILSPQLSEPEPIIRP